TESAVVATGSGLDSRFRELELLVDTELIPFATRESQDHRELVIAPNRPVEAIVTLSPGGEFSSATLKRARIALGEYARTSGIYDPVDVLTFARLCIEEATAKVSATSFDADNALLKEVLRIASASCGLGKPARGGSMEPQNVNAGDPQMEI